MTAQKEREMLLYRIDILGFSKCRCNGCATILLSNTIIYSGRDDNDQKEGVATMMSKSARRT